MGGDAGKSNTATLLIIPSERAGAGALSSGIPQTPIKSVVTKVQNLQ